MRVHQRLSVTVILLGGAISLSGCGATPTDPYSGMRMLTPQEAGATQQEQNPVLQAERVHNSKFVPKAGRIP
jgi:hypothetical protein